MKKGSLQCAIRVYNRKRGVTKTSLHLFRHTFAKNYVLAGGGMPQLQAILGHKTLDMTRKYINLYIFISGLVMTMPSMPFAKN